MREIDFYFLNSIPQGLSYMTEIQVWSLTSSIMWLYEPDSGWGSQRSPNTLHKKLHTLHHHCSLRLKIIDGRTQQLTKTERLRHWKISNTHKRLQKSSPSCHLNSTSNKCLWRILSIILLLKSISSNFNKTLNTTSPLAQTTIYQRNNTLILIKLHINLKHNWYRWKQKCFRC